MDRRTFLRRGLVGGAVLSLGGAGWLASRRGAEAAAPAQGLRVLTLSQHAVVLALARRMIPARAGLPDLEAVGVGWRFDRVLLRLPTQTRRELQQLLGLFENALGGLLFSGVVTPFTRLAPQRQDAVLRGWRDSRLSVRRTGYEALRTLVLGSYYGAPETWAGLGYPGPPAGFARGAAR